MATSSKERTTNLGLCFLVGVEKNKDEAINCFFEALARGNENAYLSFLAEFEDEENGYDESEHDDHGH